MQSNTLNVQPASITVKIEVDAKEAIETLKEVTEVANEALESLTKLGCKINDLSTKNDIATSLQTYVTSQEAKIQNDSR
ncbi:hypothetical protein CON95_27040 [Bacillus toyonensis]|uniref:hypothetical protein n=1 Tax=Bacillus toyonensis TaxID=155322 RepID=UPI000BEB9812|nr:hypothetical protein [Bacillus toyonensis]PEE20754.1 hypothetical protein CON95_27040 [Bacillus toyonensis]